MILRKLRWSLLLTLHLLTTINSQEEKSYEDEDWVPITPSSIDSTKKAEGRVLNINGPNHNFFAQNEYLSKRGPPPPQYILQESFPKGRPHKPQPYKFESVPYVPQTPPQFLPPVPFNLPQVPSVLQPIKAAPPLNQKLVAPPQNTQNYYDSTKFAPTINDSPNLGLLNQELLGAIQQQPPLTTSKPKEQKENVQLLYVPLENLKHQSQPSFHVPQQALPPQNHKQNQLSYIEDDFIKQALAAHKLQQDLQINQQVFVPSTTTTTTPKPTTKRKANQPPLSVFMEKEGATDVKDVLQVLKNANSISVLDTAGPNAPKVFVGPSHIDPDGYAKFPLPYLSSVQGNRIERKVENLPFFVAPLSYKTPNGYSKIPLPSPHVGSVVVKEARPPQISQNQIVPDFNVKQPFRQTGAQLQANQNTLYGFGDDFSTNTESYEISSSKGFQDDFAIDQKRLEQTPSYQVRLRDQYYQTTPKYQTTEQSYQLPFVSSQKQYENLQKQQVPEPLSPSNVYSLNEEIVGHSITEKTTEIPEPQFNVRSTSESPQYFAQNSESSYNIRGTTESPQYHLVQKNEQESPSYNIRGTTESSQYKLVQNNEEVLSSNSGQNYNIGQKELPRTRYTSRGKPAHDPYQQVINQFEIEEINSQFHQEHRTTTTVPTPNYSDYATPTAVRSRARSRHRSRTTTTTTPQPEENYTVLEQFTIEPKTSTVKYSPAVETIPAKVYKLETQSVDQEENQKLHEIEKPSINHHQNVYRTEQPKEIHRVNQHQNLDVYRSQVQRANQHQDENVYRIEQPKEVYRTEQPKVNLHQNENVYRLEQPKEVYRNEQPKANLHQTDENVYRLEQPKEVYRNEQPKANLHQNENVYRLEQPKEIYRSEQPTELPLRNQQQDQNVYKLEQDISSSKFAPETTRSKFESEQDQNQFESKTQDFTQQFLHETTPIKTSAEFNEEFLPKQDPHLTPLIYNRGEEINEEVLPGYNLQSHAIRPLLQPNLLVPTTEKIATNAPVVEQIITTTTTTEASTTTRRSRGRQRANSPRTSTTAPRRNTVRRRPNYTRATTERALEEVNYEATRRTSNQSRQRFRTRGRPAAKEQATERVLQTTEQEFVQPLVVYSQQSTLKPQTEEFKDYHQVYSLPTQPSNIQVQEEISTTSKPVIEIKHPVTEHVIITTPSEGSRYIKVNEEVTSRSRVRIKARTRPSTTTTFKPEEAKEEEFYGFIRQPNFNKPVATTTDVQFVGKIRPKYTTEAVEVSSEAPRVRQRARIRVPTKKPQYNEPKSDEVTRRSSVGRSRSRGKSHYKTPERKEQPLEEENYPQSFLKSREQSTERSSFQITIDPEEIDQVPHSSIYSPQVVKSPEPQWVEASILPSPNQLVSDDKPMYEISAETTVSEETEVPTTTEFIETTTPKRKVGRRRGVWKLVKQKPLDGFETAESQNYRSVLNEFDQIQKDSGTTTERSIFDTLYNMFGFASTASQLNKTAEITTTPLPTFPEEITQTEEVTDETTILPETTTELPDTTEGVKVFDVEPWEMRKVKTSTSTEVSHETKICYKGKCVRSKDEEDTTL